MVLRMGILQVDCPVGKCFKNLAFKMNKLKTKYTVLAQCKLES